VARRRRVLVVVVALIVSLAALGAALSALTGGHRSNGDYAPFADCPLSNPATDVCIFGQTESGELTLGSKTIPITRTMILQGGVHENEATGRQQFIAAKDGNTLSRAFQVVPGGLFDIVSPRFLPKLLREQFDGLIARGVTDVTATTELAAPANAIRVSTQNLIEAKGIGLSLPVKVKLSNPFLGESCYIGSNAHPIVMPLTTGMTRRSSPHKLIEGKPGHANFKDDYNLVTISEDSLISDSFAAPRAEGCGGINASRIDPAVDTALGLPVTAGRNMAILNGALRDANAPAVRASK
jgi:hypothetical protein